MSKTYIFQNRPEFSVSQALDAVADALTGIKRATGLSDAALADPLNKSPDMLRDYRLGDSEIAVYAFLRAGRAWGADFLDGPLALAGFRSVPLDDAAASCDAAKVSAVAVALAAVAQQTSPESDGGPDITDPELLVIEPQLKAAFRVLDELLQRAERVRMQRRATA